MGTQPDSIEHLGEDIARAMQASATLMAEVERQRGVIEQMTADHKAAVDGITTERDRWEREAAIQRSDNEELRRRVTAATLERDHYFRCYVASKSQMTTIAEACLAGINHIEPDSAGATTRVRQDLRGSPTRDNGGHGTFGPLPRALRPVPAAEDAAKVAQA